MAADIFEGSVGFHRNERCSLAYDNRILEKSPSGQFYKSAFSRGVACRYRVMKKNLLDRGLDGKVLKVLPSP